MKMFMMTRMGSLWRVQVTPRGFIWNYKRRLQRSDAAYALTKSAAKTLINQTVDDIVAMIASTDDEEIILAEFEKIFERYADVINSAMLELKGMGHARDE